MKAGNGNGNGKDEEEGHAMGLVLDQLLKVMV